jgi:hypothetical protein
VRIYRRQYDGLFGDFIDGPSQRISLFHGETSESEGPVAVVLTRDLDGLEVVTDEDLGL